MSRSRCGSWASAASGSGVQEFLDLCTRRDASLDGTASGLFSCRRCSLSYRGQVEAQGRPHGEGSWADEFFYGECPQGMWVEGVLLGKFQSRERQGRMRHSISCLWIVSGPRVLRNFGRTRESRGFSDAWNPQHFLATASSWAGRAQLRIRVQASRTKAYFCSRVGCIPQSSMHYLEHPEFADAH